jgi:hypothetical protein
MSSNIYVNIDEENNNIDEENKERFYEGYYSKSYLGQNREECSICMENDIFTHNSWVKLGCSHFFHRHCILIWIHNRPTCPICRENVHQSYREYIITKTKTKSSIILCGVISFSIFIIILLFQLKKY